MRKWIKAIGILCLVLFPALSTAYSEEVFPERQGFINDYAGILTSDTQNALEMQALETLRNTGTTVAAAVIPTTKGLSASEYANHLY